MGKGNSAATIQRIANQTQITLQKLVNSSNELQTRYNAQEAQKARDWQTEMSKSAHQMEVEDLKKAGLNPVLSSGGSGAQSYTTSSASAQPESGASAVAALQGSQLGALSQLEASRMAAAATKKAAAVSAAAMRSAAAQSAAAQIYSANMGYKKAKYQSDTQAKIQEGINKTNLKIAMNKPQSSPFGLIDKWLAKAGITGPAFAGIRSAVNSGNKALGKFFDNPSKYFANGSGKVTAGNFKLNNVGVNAVNSFLKSNGLAVTASNRKMAVNAFIFRNTSSLKNFASLYNSSHYAHQTHSPVTRSGHR